MIKYVAGTSVTFGSGEVASKLVQQGPVVIDGQPVQISFDRPSSDPSRPPDAREKTSGELKQRGSDW